VVRAFIFFNSGSTASCSFLRVTLSSPIFLFSSREEGGMRGTGNGEIRERDEAVVKKEMAVRAIKEGDRGERDASPVKLRQK
jgi:hypothetical protein